MKEKQHVAASPLTEDEPRRTERNQETASGCHSYGLVGDWWARMVKRPQTARKRAKMGISIYGSIDAVTGKARPWSAG